MTPEEWLGIVSWLADHDVKLTADVAVKYGAALRHHDTEKVRQACAVLVEKRRPFTLHALTSELRKPSSKYAEILEDRHRALYPNGCPNQRCDLCREG